MFLKKNAGFTLVEILISIGITATVVGAIAGYLSQQNQSVKILESDLVLHSIARTIQRAMNDPSILKNSATLGTSPGNISLRNCIQHQEGTICNSTDPKRQVSFDLILPVRNPAPLTSAILESYVIAGSDSNPALYKIKDSSPCTRVGMQNSQQSSPQNSNSVIPQNLSQAPEQDAACNVTAKVYFWATCPPSQDSLGNQAVQVDGNTVEITQDTQISQGLATSIDQNTFTYAPTTSVTTNQGAPSYAPSTCELAQSLHIRFQVAYHPTQNQGGVPLILSNLPPDKVFWSDFPKNTEMSTFGAVTIPVNTIPGTNMPTLFCPTNMIMTGVTNGKPNCECMFPFHFVAGCVPGEPCACVDMQTQCLPTERYRGIDAEGRILCCPVTCQDVVVETLSSPNDSTPLGCGVGGWIESITPISPAAPNSAPNSSCMAKDNCFMGKWGGTCTTDIVCKETYHCCYEYGGTTGTGCIAR